MEQRNRKCWGFAYFFHLAHTVNVEPIFRVLIVGKREQTLSVKVEMMPGSINIKDYFTMLM